jgi:hypothetical protein
MFFTAILEYRRNVMVEKIGMQSFIDLLQSASEVVQMLVAWLLSHLTLDGL